MSTGKNLILCVLIFTSIHILLSDADWNNILHHKNKHGLVAINNNNNNNNNLKRICESWRINVELNNIRGFKMVPQECTEYNWDYYMASAQYQSDLERAVDECLVYLNGFKIVGDEGWIFDVDDTLLSTLPYFSLHHFGGEKMNTSTMESWMRECNAPAIEQTLRLFHEIRYRGIKIFLISSRSEVLRDATVDNLINVGFYGWRKLILRGLDDEYKNVQNYKAEARNQLVENGYRLIGMVGDQWSSLDGFPVAERKFKLPNSMYYVS